jgi:histidine ammonia-lyase
VTASSPLSLGASPLTLDDIADVARRGRPVAIAPAARTAMAEARAAIDRVVADGDAAPAVYGVNTGFGALAEVRISADQVRQLQVNLVRSHAAGVGEPLPRDATRAMMLLRAAVLATGRSGARPAIADRLCAMLDAGIHPIIPRRGSVGASGDLAPLAHLALALIGEGEVEHRGARVPAAAALAAAGLAPLPLEAKEGLTLLNGTQHMTAIGALTVRDAEDTCRIADLAGAMSLEALKGHRRRLRRARGRRPPPPRSGRGRRAPARGPGRLAHRGVPTPTAARCKTPTRCAACRRSTAPTRDALAYGRAVLEREAASSTDNPLVFAGGVMISGGNFHGQPVALALDFACFAIAELANISERRVEQLVNPHLSSGLPPFLAPDSGLNSGFMIAQVSAAALVSENKVLCHPASVDSIPSSAGREDHVSMGAHAALKLAQVHDQVRTVLAIELLCAAQGLDLRRPLRSTAILEAVHAAIRATVPAMMVDRPLAPDIAAVRALIDDGTLLAAAKAAGAPL